MSGRLGLRKKKKERGKTGENHDRDCVAGPEDSPSQNCWVFSQSEDSKKVTEDIGSSVVGLVVRKGRAD